MEEEEEVCFSCGEEQRGSSVGKNDLIYLFICSAADVMYARWRSKCGQK